MDTENLRNIRIRLKTHVKELIERGHCSKCAHKLKPAEIVMNEKMLKVISEAIRGQIGILKINVTNVREILSVKWNMKS